MSVDWYLAAIAGSLFGMLMLGAFFLCLALWLDRRSPVNVLPRLRNLSVRFNLSVFVLDLLFFLAPLSVFSAYIADRFESHGFRLFMSDWQGGGVATITCGVAAVLFGDFVAYWRHRLEHIGWLWKAHVMHHSDRHMNWTTIYRFHPINRVTTAVLDGAAIAVIGFPWWAVTLNAVVRHYYGAFVHINQPWTLGWFGKVFVSPAMHRWHHVLEGEGVGKNFASIFSLFDRMFGTYYCPGPCDASLGVPGIGDGELLRQYALPFRTRDNPG